MHAAAERSLGVIRGFTLERNWRAAPPTSLIMMSGDTMAKMTFTADPFSVTVAKDKGTFGELLEAVFARPVLGFNDAGSRWGVTPSGYAIVDRLTSIDAHTWVGTAFQSKMNDLQQKGTPAGPKALDLLINEGLGKHVAFLWDGKRETLWFQRDRQALAVGTFMDHLKDRSDISASHAHQLSVDADKRALAMKRIKWVSFSMHTQHGSGSRLKDAPLFREFFTMQKRYGGAKIKITITPDRGTFLGGDTKELVKQAVELTGTDDVLKHAIIAGTIESSAKEAELAILDLVQDKLRFWAVAEAKRFRDPEALMKLVTRVWKENRGDVQ